MAVDWALKGVELYLGKLQKDSAWVFLKHLSVGQAESLLGLNSVSGLLTYHSDQAKSLSKSDRIGFLSNNRTHRHFPCSRAKRLVFNEMPRLDFLPSHVTQFAARGIFNFTWISPAGPINYSLLRFAKLYCSFRLSNSSIERFFAFTRPTCCFHIRQLTRLSDKWPPHTSPNSRWTGISAALAIGSVARGGAERQLVNTAIGLARSGFSDLQVLCLDLASSPEQRAYLSELTHKGILPKEAKYGDRTLPETLHARLTDLLEQIADSPDLADAICRLTYEFWLHRPHVVHAWLDFTNIAAGLAAVITGVPKIILGCRNVAPDKVGLNRSFMKPLYRFLCQQNNVVFVSNSRAGAADYRVWLGLNSLPFSIISNGVVPSIKNRQHSKIELRKTFGFPQDCGPIIGTVARFVDQKQPVLWLRVAEILSKKRGDLKFLMVGDGQLLEHCRRTANKMGLSKSVIFTGALTDPCKAFQLMDCFLMTSKQEGLPNSLLEAQSIGIPVVISRAGGAPEAILDGVTGIVVDDPQPSHFAEAVLNIIDDKTFLTTARAHGPIFIENKFGLTRMIESTAVLYRKHLGRLDEDAIVGHQ